MNRKERRARERQERGAAGPAGAADAESLFRAGYAHHRAGRPAEALALYRRVLALQPDNPEVLHLAGMTAFDQGLFEDAAEMGARAVAGMPARPEFRGNLGNALQALGRTAEAEAAYHEALRLAPGFADAHYNLGNLLRETGRSEAAAEAYRGALKTQPNNPKTLHNLGLALQAQGRLEEAATALRQAIEIRPDLGRAHCNLGNVLRHLSRPSEAIACFRRALDCDPADRQALLWLAETLEEGGAYPDADRLFRRILAAEPSHVKAAARFLRMLEYSCAWDDVARYRPRVRKAALEAMAAGQRPAEHPLEAVARDMDPAYLLEIARAYSRTVAAAAAPFRESVAAVARPSANGRITVGYLSSDFRNHPTSHLMGGLFAHHDRTRFRVIAYSTGPDDHSAYRAQVAAGCDAFVDLWSEGAIEAARRIRADGVDILVDVNGHTTGNRLDILALRPAPVQVAYLAFPGTTGADFFDYALVDAVVVPSEQVPFFTEKPVFLPDTYQVNGPQPIAADRPTRRDCGLPEDAFVFVSFCAPYKIEPVMFGLWMDILARVPDSVLWLFRGNSAVEGNLRREAVARGMAPERLVFGEPMPKDRHLARLGLADLGLDTRIYGGHTTTSDMLWAGVPVISALGGHFASRVGASLLKAAGLDELAVADLEAYRELAVRLAGDRGALAALRDRLAENRHHSALFDTARFARHLESAYAEMWARHGAGQPPAAFAVGRT